METDNDLLTAHDGEPDTATVGTGLAEALVVSADFAIRLGRIRA